MAGYPLVDESPASVPPAGADRPRGPSVRGAAARWLLLLVVLLIHAALCLASMGGWTQLVGPWPLPWHDHPMHYHNAVVTRSFLVQNGTTAGYDPYFMAGYAKSIVSDPSGTLIEVVVALFGRDRPEVAYKGLVLASIAGLPWLISGTIRLLGGGSGAVLAGTIGFLIYLWTDYPLQYAAFGMIAFLLVVPVGLLVLALVMRFVDRGGLGRWIWAVIGATALALVHPLAVLTVVPATLAGYLGEIVSSRRRGERYPAWRHVGLWVIPPIVAASNAFWWLPGLTLAATRDTEGPDFFSHQEPVWERIAQVFGMADPPQPTIQMLLLGGALIGLPALIRRRQAQGIALAVFLGSGLFWGYLAGGFRAFDFLQPGRWTYAAFTASAVASGLGWSAVRDRLARDPGRLDRWAAPALLLIGLRLFGPELAQSLEFRTGRELVAGTVRGGPGRSPLRFFSETGRMPFLASAPGEDLGWLVARIREHFGPGDRILYEEGGKANGALTDPFGGRRLGGLLPTLAGVEVIGGPFLHVPVRENFTQFGMGRLFGIEEWGRGEFEQYAGLYGPEGMVCWSPRARAFCRENPDLCEILEDREPILIVRIRGFEGDAIRGEATVEAEAGRLKVEPVSADVDGMIVLRYHSVPGLRSDPPGLLRAVELPGDPVPFIGLARAEGPVTIEWDAPP